MLKPQGIYLEFFKAVLSDFQGNAAVTVELGKIPHAAENPVCNAGSSPAAFCHQKGRVIVDFGVEDSSASLDNRSKLFVSVKIKALYDSEACLKGL